MSACKKVTKWVVEEIQVPVEKFFEKWEERCNEYKKKVEEKVIKPMEKWVSKRRRKCKKRKWYDPRRWFCWLLTIFVKIVEWVCEVIIKWVVYFVCKIVKFIVKVIVMAVVRVGKWVVGFVTCLFTDPKEAGKSFRDLWTDLVDIVEECFDFIESLLDDVTGVLDDIEDLVDFVLDHFGPLGTFFAGIFDWIWQLWRDIVDIARDIVANLQEIISGILRLNWCRIAAGFTGLGADVGRAILVPFHCVGGVISGVRNSFQLEKVKEIIESALSELYGDNDDRIEDVLDKINYGSPNFGLPIMIDSRRLFISSRSESINLKGLHDEGVIDLYAAAGHLSDCGKKPLNRPRWEVVYAETKAPVSYHDLKLFLKEGPESAPEFHVFPIPKDVFERYLDLSRRKARFLGLAFGWDKVKDQEASNINISDTEIFDSVVIDHDKDTVLFKEYFNRQGKGDDLCTAPALAVFRYKDDTLNGHTRWYRLPNEVQPSGVSFRDRQPEALFRWSLIHELGHYFGLDHEGHDGAHHIMFTNDPDEDMDMVTGGTVLEFLLFTGEPKFTLDDARNCWRWITENAAACLEK